MSKEISTGTVLKTVRRFVWNSEYQEFLDPSGREAGWVCSGVKRHYDIGKARTIFLVLSKRPHAESNKLMKRNREAKFCVMHENGSQHTLTYAFNDWLNAAYNAGYRHIRVEIPA